MKLFFACIAISLLACNESANSNKTNSKDSGIIVSDPPNKAEENNPIPGPSEPKLYSNARFKDVTVKKTGENEYTIEGKGQIFEANFNYVVEDGHEELKKGYQTTDAGAPAWGKFKFSLDVPKKRGNSTLTLILFEISAEDGRRTHELPIRLTEKE